MAYWLYSVIHQRNRLIAGALVYCSGISLFFLYNLYIFGSISPYGPKDLLTNDLFWRYSAYLFDADRGLFGLNPLLFLAFIGISQLFKESIPKFLLTTLLIIFGHLPNLFHTYFWLGSCPVGRYWIVVYPLMAYLAAMGLNRIFIYLTDDTGKRYQWAILAVFLVISSLFILSFLQVYTFLRIPENFYTHFKKVYIMCGFVIDQFHLNLKPIYYSFFVAGTGQNLIYWYSFLIFFLLIGFFLANIKERRQKEY
ncbi:MULTISPECIES: hypothetical protein [unclassified Leptospira]|uniref:hypothetical protein n=1 Tax=unclassified Leptospira TaxID=2633828 RepID=UPI0012F6D55A|nr:MULTISPECIES: hypothetical protein [unclassified Leptospira]MCR1795603.1 hypothetical protein [Leptospira sp. id769339]